MARITKILEGTLSTGNTTVTFTDNDIPNSLIRVYATNSDVYPSEITLSGNTLTVKYQAQTTTLYIAVELVKAGLEIIDNVTSDDDTAALSAKQGKYLNSLIYENSIPNAITEPETDDMLLYDGVEEQWYNTPFPSIPSQISDLSDVTLTSPSDGQTLVYDDGEWVNGNVSGGGIDYSLSEQDTGLKWIDGSTIYEKTIETGGLPNYSDKAVAHGISNLKRIISVIGNAKNTVNNYYIPLPYVQNDVSYQAAIYIDNTNIHLTTGRNMTAYDESYVTVRYIKTS